MENNESKKMTTTIIIVMLVLIFIVTTVIVYMLITNKDNNSNNNNNNTNQQENKKDEEKNTFEEISFKKCINGTEESCIQNIILDGKEVKMSTIKEDDYSWEFRLNDQKIHSENVFLELGFDNRVFNNTGKFLFKLLCGPSGCGNYVVIDKMGSKEIALDKDFYPSWSKKDEYKVLNNSEITFYATRRGQQAEVVTINGKGYLCANDIPDNTLIDVQYKIKYLGNNNYNIEKVSGTEVYFNELTNFQSDCN